MRLSVRQYAPQSGGGNSHKNQDVEGQAGKDGSQSRSTKKTTEKKDPDKTGRNKKNANSID